MLLVPVESSDIAAIGYDPDGQEMQIQFTTGRIYSYQPFPQSLYQSLFDAPSKGQFFAQNIKKFPGMYPYTRLDGINSTPTMPGTSSGLDADVIGGSQILQNIEQFEGLL